MTIDKSLFIPKPIEVDIRPDIDRVFNSARKAANELREVKTGKFHQQVIIITPGRLIISKICPLKEDIPQYEIARFSRLLPLLPPKNIAVIANTFLEALKTDVIQTIPFFGYLLGFASLGHSVWIFEGDQSALASGSREADILMVDSAMLPFLEKIIGWRDTALHTMRGNEIKIIAR